MDAVECRRWERLINDRGIVIDRPHGQAHPLYSSEPKFLVSVSRADAGRLMALLDRGDPRPDLHLAWRDAAA